MSCKNCQKILSLDTMKTLSIDEIIDLYKNDYRLKENESIYLLNTIPVHHALNVPKVTGLSPGNCPTQNVIQGTSHNITISIAGGSPPYIFHFYRDGTEIRTSPAQTSTTYTFSYTPSQANGDTLGLHRYSTDVTDSCTPSQRSGPDYCDITIQSPITVGSVIFHTSPAGAHIVIGGVDKGPTGTDGSLKIDNLLAGTLYYDVTLTGYNPSTNNAVTVVAGSVVDAPLVTLTPITPGTGSVRFHTNPGNAGIWKGTTLLCTTDSSGVCTVTGQTVGTLTFVVKKTNYIDSSPTNVTVVENTTVDAPTVTLSPKTGNVRFHTNPGGANIWVGVDNYGPTDPTGLLTINNIPVGTLYFIAKKTGYIDSAQTAVTVIENTTVDSPTVTLTPVATGKGSVIFHTNPGQIDIYVATTRLGTTDLNGTLRIDNLDVGTLSFYGRKSGYYDSPITNVTVVEGGVVDAPTITMTAIPGGGGVGINPIFLLAGIGILGGLVLLSRR